MASGTGHPDAFLGRLPREEFGDEVLAFFGDIGELPRQFVGVGESATRLGVCS